MRGISSAKQNDCSKPNACSLTGIKANYKERVRKQTGLAHDINWQAVSLQRWRATQ